LKSRCVLIIGAGSEQIPLILAARDLGVGVIAVDKDPQAPGFASCESSQTVDIADRRGCLETAKKYQIEGVVTSTERGLLSAGMICDDMGLPGCGLNIVERIKNKLVQAEVLRGSGVACARTARFSRRGEDFDLSWPRIIKPPDNAGARGVLLVNNEEEQERAFVSAKTFTAEDYVIVQEFIDGDEYGAEAVVQNSTVVDLVVTKKTSCEPPFFVVMGHRLPFNGDKDILKKIRDAVERSVTAFDIKDAMVNFDFRIKDNEVFVLELGPRLGGNQLPRLIALAGGADNYRNAVLMALGDPVSSRYPDQAAGIHYFEADRSGVLRDIQVSPELMSEGDISFEMFKRVGEPVAEVRSFSDRLGFCIVKGQDLEDVEQKIGRVLRDVRFEIT